MEPESSDKDATFTFDPRDPQKRIVVNSELIWFIIFKLNI